MRRYGCAWSKRGLLGGSSAYDAAVEEFDSGGFGGEDFGDATGASGRDGV
jgi:hypothetical protein